MAFENITLGLTLSIPTSGTKNWAANIKTGAWNVISQHRHQGSGDGLQMVTGSLGDNIVTTAKLSKNYGYTIASTLTPAGTTQTIDFSNGNVQVLDLDSASGDVTVTLSNPASGSYYTIFIIQAATPRNVIWPVTAKWPGQVAPILSQANNAIDKVYLFWNGTEYRGDWEQNYS